MSVALLEGLVKALYLGPCCGDLMPTERTASREKAFDVLALVVHQAEKDVRKYWDANETYPTLLLAWPTAHDVPYEVVNMAVPEGMKSLDAAKALTSRTRAYALFLLEQHKNCIKLILETQTSALSVTLPIEQHGDTRALGTAQTKKDSENLGVLFRPGRLLN